MKILSKLPNSPIFNGYPLGEIITKNKEIYN